MSETKILKQDSMTLPAGTYYVGDLCYLLEDSVYDDYVCAFTHEDEIVEIETEDGIKFLASHSNTAYGDGGYKDNLGNEYGVDAGIIGIVQLVDEEMLNKAKKEEASNMAKVIEFEEAFTVEYNDGVFDFGHIHIDTTGDSDEDEPEDDDWSDEDDEDDEYDENY